MKPFNFSNLILTFIASPLARVEELTAWDEKLNCHLVRINTTPFSAVSVLLSESAAKYLGLNSPSDAVNILDGETADEINQRLGVLYPAVTMLKDEDGDDSFQIWILTAEEYNSTVESASAVVEPLSV